MCRILIIVITFCIGSAVVYYSLNKFYDEPLVPVLVSAKRIPYVNIIKHIKPETSLSCLTKTIYFEAQNQGTDGMTAVANVVMNRVQDDNFPNSVCAVAYQKANVHGKVVCQFSWHCDGRHHRIHYDAAWKASKAVARAALKGMIDHVVGNAKFYHASYVLPAWAAQKTQVAIIGDHIFYE